MDTNSKKALGVKNAEKERDQKGAGLMKEYQFLKTKKKKKTNPTVQKKETHNTSY